MVMSAGGLMFTTCHVSLERAVRANGNTEDFAPFERGRGKTPDIPAEIVQEDRNNFMCPARQRFEQSVQVLKMTPFVLEKRVLTLDSPWYHTKSQRK